MNNNLKIQGDFTFGLLVEKIVQNSKLTILFNMLKKILLVDILFSLIYQMLYYLVLNRIFKNITFIVFIFWIVFYTYSMIVDILYELTKEFGGKKTSYFHIAKNLKFIEEATLIIRKYDRDIFKKILKINNLYNIYSLEKISRYFEKNDYEYENQFDLKKVIKYSFGTYLTIIFGIIGVYISLNNNLENLTFYVIEIFAKSFIIFLIILTIIITIKFNNIDIYKIFSNKIIPKNLNEILVSKELVNKSRRKSRKKLKKLKYKEQY